MRNDKNDPKCGGGKHEPWWPRDVINYINAILQPTFDCFEWGSGRSSKWLADRVKSLITIDNNQEWTDSIPDMPNIEKHCLNLKSGYAEAIVTHSKKDRKYDFIFVDGRNRVACIKAAKPFLKEGGFLMLDNSDRKRYNGAWEELKLWPFADFHIFCDFERRYWGNTIWRNYV